MGADDNSGDDNSANPTIDVSALGDCIFSQFPGTVLLDATPTVGLGASGSGPDPGNVNGTATLSFTGWAIGTVGTITNDIQSQSLQDMAQLPPSPVYSNGDAGPGVTAGDTDVANPSTNYTAMETVGQAAVDTQVWELGNSISVIENGPPAPGQYENAGQDPGAALSQCYQNATGTSQ